MTKYRDDAVFMPGEGLVLFAPVGTTPPTYSEITAWMQGTTSGLLKQFVPIGYTSLDELPQIGGDTEGGEVKGVWENPSFRTTPVKTTETVTITPVQFSETTLKHRFGANGTIGEDGYFHVPLAYQSSEVSLLVIIVDGTHYLVFHYPRVASAPGDAIELDAENFVGMPTVYTVLQAPGQPKFRVGHPALEKDTEPEESSDDESEEAAG